MPIKFRCQHCRQFLGISRAMAEKVVDCPGCGRSIRVPDLEGNTAPVPQPQLDLRDSSLVDALDRLASIGSVPGLVLADSETPSDESGELLEESHEPVALGAPKPVPVPVPVTETGPPEPIPVEPPAPAAPVPNLFADPAAQSGSRSAAMAASSGAGSSSASLPTAKPGRRTLIILSALVLGLASALGGLLIGRFTADPDREVAEKKDGEDNEKPAPIPTASGVSGTILYRTESGDKPDAGAAVLLLPDERTGSAKIDVVGLRPGDAAADFDVARAALIKMGGDAAVVDDEGRFVLEPPAAGTYRIIVFSHYQPRPPEELPKPPLKEALGRFLQSPNQIFGQRRFESARIRWQGADPVSWNHTFTDPDG